MTEAVRAERDVTSRFVVLFAFVLFCWSHRHALQLSGFSDDIGLLAELPPRAVHGTLLADVFAKWIGPLWPGSLMWRPLPHSSFALDAAVWGHASGAWRITNLLLHLGVATFTGLIATRLIKLRLAGAAAFAAVLLVPWSPEVTLWLVGRFDGWVTFAIVVSLWAALKSVGPDRWCALSLAAAIAAYASKESALILPVWIALVVVLPTAAVQTRYPRKMFAASSAAVRTGGGLIGGHIVVALAYLAWRSYLFSDPTVSVYASTPEYRVFSILARLTLHLGFPVALAPLAPIAASVVLGGVLLTPFALRKGNRAVAFVGCVMALLVVIAVAIHLANPPGSGEGYRLYYLATVGLALVVATTVQSSSKLSVALLAVFMVALAVWQSRVAAEWLHASRTIEGASSAMTSAAKTLSSKEFGLVLMPDLMQHVPLARNAQGALLTLKDGTSPARGFFIIFTPTQLAEWHQLAQEDVVKKLTQRASAPPRVTRYYCFNSSTLALEDLGYWSPATLLDWQSRWREIVAARCPDLAL